MQFKWLLVSSQEVNNVQRVQVALVYPSADETLKVQDR